MRIYIAGRYGRRLEFAGYAERMKALGATITARWLEGEHEAKDGSGTLVEQRGWAEDDLVDIDGSSAMWVFTEHPTSGHSRGGRHVELGYGIARATWHEMRVVVIGPRENVFCCLDEVVHYETFEEAVAEELAARDDAA